MTLSLSTDKRKIRTIIDQAFKEEILIPEFQRDFVWKAEDIKELLTSIFGGYFIGTILLHQNTIGNINFEVKPLPALQRKKVSKPSENTIVDIILDGQQRLNSILYAVTFTTQTLPNSKNPHRFFLHIPTFLQGNIQECIIYATENLSNKKFKEILKKEYFALRAEYEQEKQKRKIEFKDFLLKEHKNIEYIDLSKLFNQSVNDDIIDQIYDDLREIMEPENAQKIRKAFRNFLDYEIFYIQVPQTATIEDIVEIFERINKTSYKLSTTDLLFAKLYKEGLRKEEVEELINSVKDGFTEFKEVNELDSALVLKVLALLVDKEPKPKQLITLTAENFNENKDIIKSAISQSLEYLKSNLGVTGKNIAYTSMLVPLIAMFAYYLKLERIKGNSIRELKDLTLKYIKQWYFANIFSERYDEGAATKGYQDFKRFKEFLNKAVNNREEAENSIKDYIGIEEVNIAEFFKPKAKNSAFLKGFISLLILNEVKDFKSEEILSPLKASDDHIFPRKWFKNKKVADIVLNRTLLLPETNKYLKKASKPSEFFEELLKEKKDRLINILNTHFISKEGLNALLKDDFKNFLKSRLEEVQKFLEEKDLIPKGVRIKKPG